MPLKWLLVETIAIVVQKVATVEATFFGSDRFPKNRAKALWVAPS